METEFLIKKRCETHTSWYCECAAIEPPKMPDSEQIEAGGDAFYEWGLLIFSCIGIAALAVIAFAFPDNFLSRGFSHPRSGQEAAEIRVWQRQVEREQRALEDQKLVQQLLIDMQLEQKKVELRKALEAKTKKKK